MCVLGIGDDAAAAAGAARHRQLVVAMDTLNAGVHFPEDTAPADIGWKALAVNLSDLAAMGATPAWCTLVAVVARRGRATWSTASSMASWRWPRMHDVALVGGDTTRGPLSICVTAHGFVDAGHGIAPRRAHGSATTSGSVARWAMRRLRSRSGDVEGVRCTFGLN